VKLSDFIRRHFPPYTLRLEVLGALLGFAAIALTPAVLLYKVLKASFTGAWERIKDEFGWNND
jgi:hypothetical protein